MEIRELVIGVLEDEFEEYQIETARDGAEALSKIAQRQQAPALVLSDVHMFGMDGIELFTQLRLNHPEREGFASLPIVIMSASMNNELLQEKLEGHGVEIEPFAFLPKPFMLEALIAQVEFFLPCEIQSLV
jgi:CheY-like chemotaxis protein